jgi:hypothetical protein
VVSAGSSGAGRGHKVGQAVGGEPIQFGPRAGTAAVFGYPSEPPYTGSSLDYCEGTLQPDPYGLADEGIACAMTEGGSGGPWLSNFDPRTGLGVVTGVTTFRYSGQDRILYSADLGSVAQALYSRAAALLRLGLSRLGLLAPRPSCALALEGRDLAGQGEVVGGQAARRVGAQRQRHLVPRDRHVRMVTGGLGQVRDGTQVQQGVAEVGAGGDGGDGAAVTGPGR